MTLPGTLAKSLPAVLLSRASKALFDGARMVMLLALDRVSTRPEMLLSRLVRVETVPLLAWSTEVRFDDWAAATPARAATDRNFIAAVRLFTFGRRRLVKERARDR